MWVFSVSKEPSTSLSGNIYPIALTVTRETYQVVNHQTQPALGGTVNFGYHESKTGKNIVKVEAIDIRKKTGFDKAQRVLQNNVIRNLVL